MENTNVIKRFFSTLLGYIISSLVMGLFLPYWLVVYPINDFFTDVLKLDEVFSLLLTTILFLALFMLFNVYLTISKLENDFKIDLSFEKEAFEREKNTIRNKIINEANNEKNKILFEANNEKQQILHLVDLEKWEILDKAHADSREKYEEAQNIKKQLEDDIKILNSKKTQCEYDIETDEKKLATLLKNIEKTKNKFSEIKNEVANYTEKIKTTNTIDYPWLAELYADIAYIEEQKIAKILETKKRPALGTAKEIKEEISKEKRIIQEQLKMAQNQLNYYETVFPWLEEFKEVDPIEAYESIKASNSNDEYTRIKNYISPEEFQKLSTAEKYQLALDRWRNKQNKTAWQIGIDYERYIGYVYECKGYKVTYNGAIKGLEDMGRDIIAENDKEILVVQCKYWKKEKIIHEKHIFQLYGTVILEKMQTKKKVKGVFITSATLSETALAVAKELKIEIQSEIPFKKDYPCIKCNINHSTGEKIYHLPFDQQYNTTHIELDKGEYYVKTTKEAEERGFRHAFKHIYG